MQSLAQVVALDDDAMRRLLDNIPVGIGIAEPVEPDGSIKPDARIVYYNKHWVKMFGFDVGDVRTVEEATRRLYPDPALFQERMRSRIEAAARRRAGGGEQTEARAMGADGNWLTVLTGTTVVGDRLVVTMLDITEDKKAEENLRRTLMNLPIPVACGTNDESPRIALVNRAFTENFGYTQEDLPTVQRWLELAYPDSDYRAEVLNRWLEGMEKGRQSAGAVDRNTVRVHCKDGTVRDVIFSATLLPSGPVVTFQDITDLQEAARQAADASAKAEAEATMRERITLAARAAKSAFWDWDIATNTVIWSPEMMDLFGVAKNERNAELDTWKVWRERLHPDDLPEAERNAMAAYHARAPLNLEYRIVRPSGDIRWIETRGDIVRDEAGLAARIAGISTDVSDRKNAEQNAEAYRAQLEQLLAERTSELDAARRQLEKTAYEVTENIPAGTYTMVQPADGGFARFSFLSTRFLEICGVSREEAEKDTLKVFACIHPGDYDEWMRKNVYVFEHKLPFSEECRIVVDGEVRWVHAESVPRDLPDGSVVWEGVLTDITARKKAELALAAANERERRSAKKQRTELERKLKTSLAASAVAHEINQPLSAILLDSQMALARIKGESQELDQARDFLSATIAHAERTVATIGKMSSLLRSVQTEPHDVNLVVVVRSAELYAKDDLRADGITLRLEGVQRAMKIGGDEGQLVLAVSNLLRNAIEAIRAGRTGRPPEIVISLAREGKSVVLSVADSGPGLPRETLAKIPLHTTKPQGTGLGLFIVQAVAENHGAQLEARRSRLGGAELRLVFPAKGKPQR